MPDRAVVSPARRTDPCLAARPKAGEVSKIELGGLNLRIISGRVSGACMKRTNRRRVWIHVILKTWDQRDARLVSL